MNKITTLAAISMFAVIMGAAAFAPAFAAGSNGQKTTLCHFEAAHFDEELQEDIPDTWSVITVNDRSLPAHLGDEDHEGHGDTIVTTQEEEDACLANNES
jgi:cytochrome c1